MNGAVKHGPTKDESFIGVRKTIVILQHFVSTLDMLKYNYEASSFCTWSVMSHGIKLE